MRKTFRSSLMSIAALVLLAFSVPLVGCDDDNDGPGPNTGVFTDSPVAGLSYETENLSGITGQSGTFRYWGGETVTFAIGDLLLGEAAAAETLSPIDLVPEATDATDDTVVNMSRLLQTLDKDGDLNNGIEITEEIAAIVSDYADVMIFNQAPAAFGSDGDVSALLAELNAAEAFTDLDPRDRSLRSAADAEAHLVSSLSERRTVTTSYGDLSGFTPQANTDTWQFLGIPYAKPPVGELRWRPPQPPESWSGDRDATAWADQAAQPTQYEAYGEGGMSEDCLYLNVTVPKDADDLPVMVYFHGGGFKILTGNTQAFNNPESLPTKGVVLVTVNHRLGPFGYMAHQALTDESEYGGSGNYGQMDLVAALEWVQENIAAFGGNPDNVTIFGESGGGMKSLSLMASGMAEGLFHRVICESGMASPLPEAVVNLEAAEARGAVLIDDQLGAENLSEMRAAHWTEIVSQPAAAYDSDLLFWPNIDNYYMTQTYGQSITDGLANDVPLMSGVNSSDMESLFTGFETQMPMHAANNAGPQYAYVFTHVPADWASQVGAYHGIELVYVFNYPGSFYSHYLLGLTGLEPEPGKTPAQIVQETGYGAADVQLTDTVMTLWTNFARTGDPTDPAVNGVPDWTAYTAANDSYLAISTTPEIKTGVADAYVAP